LDRVRVDWTKGDVYFRTRIIDWSNCQYNDVKTTIDVQNDMADEIIFNNVVVYNDTFDVFFYNQAACQSGRCKVTFNEEGRPIAPAESFLPKDDIAPLSQISPFGNSTTTRGYFIFTLTSNQLAVKIWNKDANKEAMKIRSEGYTTYGLSSKFGMFGLCWLPMRGDTTVRCVQIDSNGRTKLDETFVFGYRVLLVRLLNARDAGFFMLQLVCTDSFCAGHKSFYLTKINSDGSRSNKSLEIGGIELDVSILDRYRINVFEKNSSGDLCMSFAGPATLSEFDIVQQKPRMAFVTKCFEKKDFF